MINKNIDPQSLKRGLKENKRLKERFDNREMELQKGYGAVINFQRDIDDENYKFNHLRTKLIERGIIKN